jgi:phage/plasmid primase-like uncharacterized protein
MAFIDAKELKQKAAGHWDHIIRSLGPSSLHEALDKPGRHFTCPVHNGKGGDGFRFFRDVAHSGGGICNTCGSFADGFKLLQWSTGDDFKEVLKRVENLIGNPATKHEPRKAVSRPVAPVSTQKEDSDIRARLRSVYKTSLPMSNVASEPARLYLRNRGLTLVPSMLRMHPGLHYHDKDLGRSGPFPTIISAVVDPDYHGVCIHRIYITNDGKKAPVRDAKKLMSHASDSPMRGACVRLFPHGPVLGVAEGIETAIAVTEATGIPCWAAITSTLLPYFVPPADVQRVVVFADKDLPSTLHPGGAGQDAGRTLVTNLWEKKIKASLAIPPSPIPDGAKSVDWLDEYNWSGRNSFKEVWAA